MNLNLYALVDFSDTNMKHAILILGHKNLSHITHLVEYFERGCDIFIHLDKKGYYPLTELECLRNKRCVEYISQDYEVNWGGTSVLESEMHLLQIAFEHSYYDYFHLISGQDYPTRPLQQFFDFFEENEGKEFLQYVRLPHPKWENGTFKRLQYFYPYDIAYGHTHPRKWVREQVQIQLRKGQKRQIPDEFDYLYGSSQWFSITNRAVQQLLVYTHEHPSLFHRMWMTFAPEECYVATVILNLVGKESVFPWNCRFIRWMFENGNKPANLGKEHFLYLLEREYLFARKFDGIHDKDLISLIDKYLLHDTDLHIDKNGAWLYNGYLKYKFEQSFCDFVTQFWWEVSINSGIDLGCGDGRYVAIWRQRGMPFSGYDANPNTPQLSSLLLPEGDTPCGIADLTENLESDTPFDLVVCKDVLPYIPKQKEKKVIENLTNLSSHFILLGWNCEYKGRTLDENVLASQFSQRGFEIERYMTRKLRMALKKERCIVLIKNNSQIINHKI